MDEIVMDKKTNTQNEEKLPNIHILSEAELAEYLHLPRWTIRSLRLKSGLPYFRTERRVFYCLETVIDWIRKECERNRQILPESEQASFTLN